MSSNLHLPKLDKEEEDEAKGEKKTKFNIVFLMVNMEC